MQNLAKKKSGWKTLSSKVFFKTPWTTFKHNEFEMPNGKKGDYYFVSTNGSSMVIPILSDGNIVLVRQYRYLVDRESIEFPNGGVKDYQKFLDAAHKELEEETGYVAKELIFVGEMVPFNGVTDEICKVYIARNLFKTKQNLDETEEGMEVISSSREEVDKMISDNKIQDGQTLAAWAMAKLWLDSNLHNNK